MNDLNKNREYIEIFNNTLERVKGMSVEQLEAEHEEAAKAIRRAKALKLAIMHALTDKH
jgi:hypothetical protein